MTASLDYITSVTPKGSRPFYGTIWFNVFATAVVICALFLTASAAPQIGGRSMAGIGQFGVVLVAVYWVLVFPKLRKVRR
jgi:hypothetical protein